MATTPAPPMATRQPTGTAVSSALVRAEKYSIQIITTLNLVGRLPPQSALLANATSPPAYRAGEKTTVSLAVAVWSLQRTGMLASLVQSRAAPIV